MWKFTLCRYSPWISTTDRTDRDLAAGMPDCIFLNQNTILGKFWRVLQWKVLVYFTAIWSILRLFGIFCGHLEYFMVMYLLYFPPFWYVLQSEIWQPCLVAILSRIECWINWICPLMIIPMAWPALHLPSQMNDRFFTSKSVSFLKRFGQESVLHFGVIWKSFF
jgi:hypothetical protein